jgi:hypothetical protein
MEGTDMNWRKSTYSVNAGNCVETATASGVVLVRDTASRDGGTIEFTASAWSAFLGAVKRG